MISCGVALCRNFTFRSLLLCVAVEHKKLPPLSPPPWKGGEENKPLIEREIPPAPIRRKFVPCLYTLLLLPLVFPVACEPNNTTRFNQCFFAIASAAFFACSISNDFMLLLYHKKEKGGSALLPTRRALYRSYSQETLLIGCRRRGLSISATPQVFTSS